MYSSRLALDADFFMKALPIEFANISVMFPPTFFLSCCMCSKNLFEFLISGVISFLDIKPSA